MVEGEAHEAICRFCGTSSKLERVFCLGCNRRLLPVPPFSLSVDDFASPGDTSNLQALRGTEPLPRLVEKFVSPGRQKSEAWLSRNAFSIRPPTRLDAIIRACAEVIGVEKLPRAYVAPTEEVNAFASGTDQDPLLVVTSPALKLLNYVELEGVLAHELAHIRSKHVLYHNLAESIASGAQVAASAFAAGLVSVPIRMLLLAWYRESEVSADRASLLFLGSQRLFASMMVGLVRAEGPGALEEHSGDSLAELLQTHPTFSRRLRLVNEYAGTQEYANARSKLLAASSNSYLAAACRFCGLVSPRSEQFCPNCGLSRL